MNSVFNARNIFVYAMGMKPRFTFTGSGKYADKSIPIIEWIHCGEVEVLNRWWQYSSLVNLLLGINTISG